MGKKTEILTCPTPQVLDRSLSVAQNDMSRKLPIISPLPKTTYSLQARLVCYNFHWMGKVPDLRGKSPFAWG